MRRAANPCTWTVWGNNGLLKRVEYLLHPLEQSERHLRPCS